MSSSITAQEPKSPASEAPLMTLVDAALLESSATAAAKSSEVSVDGKESIDSSRHSTGSLGIASVSSSSAAAATDFKAGFVELLRQTLDNEQEHSDIITWMPDGKAFTIVNHKRFVKEFMPKIFSIKNMSSFVRKLSRFGFARKFDKEKMNPDIFAHPEFVQGQPERDTNIKCAPIAKPASTAVSLSAVNKAKASAAAAAAANSRRTSIGAQVLSRAVSQEHIPHAMSGSAALFAPPSPTTPVPAATTGAPLQAAIASLMQEREALRQGADANTLALVHLLQEQERARRASLPSLHSPAVLQEQLHHSLALQQPSPSQSSLLLSSYLHGAAQQRRYSLQNQLHALQNSSLL